ncbi:hypothetical protein AAVH_25198 [Aphelenchoides avenae]|nr:hypothetical protein AAVH_25198 [Aphelenchus avenae]
MLKTGDEEGRRLHVHEPQISSRFISKLMKAARTCKSDHKLEMNLTIRVDLDIDDFVGNGEQMVIADGFKVWKFDFVGQPNLHVHYVPKQQADSYWIFGKLCCWRNATPPDY